MQFEELVTFLRFYNTESKENLLVFDADLVIKTAASFKITQQVKDLEEEFAAQNSADSAKLSKLKTVSAEIEAEDEVDSDSGSFIAKEDHEEANKAAKNKKKPELKKKPSKKEEKKEEVKKEEKKEEIKKEEVKKK